jgi:hypothetical protein
VIHHCTKKKDTSAQPINASKHKEFNTFYTDCCTVMHKRKEIKITLKHLTARCPKIFPKMQKPNILGARMET